VSGEGKTMDKKLHTFKEVNINNLFQKLYINVSEVELKSSPNVDESKFEDASHTKKQEVGENNIAEKNEIKCEETNKKIIDEILNRSKEEQAKSKCLII
jgi:hypothetical protein